MTAIQETKPVIFPCHASRDCACRSSVSDSRVYLEIHSDCSEEELRPNGRKLVLAVLFVSYILRFKSGWRSCESLIFLPCSQPNHPCKVGEKEPLQGYSSDSRQFGKRGGHRSSESALTRSDINRCQAVCLLAASC